jgi:tetratricopeptide (TPR) repeat protein
MERTRPSAPVLWARILPLFAAIALPACSRPAPASKAQAPGHTKPSEAEQLAYAKSVVTAFEAKDRQAFNDAIDWKSIHDIAAAGLNMSEKEIHDLVASMRLSADNDRGFASSLIANASKGGSFHFLGPRQRQGRTVLLFRMAFPLGRGGIAYFEFVPRRFPDGKVRAADIYVYMAGEYLSDAFRRIMLPVIAERSRNIFDKLVVGEQDYLKDLPEVARAGGLVNQGKPAEAMAIYKTLRPGTLKDKTVLVGRLRAAQALGEKECLAVLEEFEKRFPKDPCLDLISIDAFLLKNDIPGALNAVDRLDLSVGGDPYLDVLRASYHDALGDLNSAAECARRAIEREPTLVEAYLTLLELLIKQEKYDEALARMKELREKFDVPLDDIDQREEYAGFVKSPQYAKWLEYCKTRAKPAPAQQVPPAVGGSTPE